MLDRRTRKLLGQAMIMLFGPVIILASFLLANQSAEGVSERTLQFSYLVLALGIAVIACGALLWARNN